MHEHIQSAQLVRSVPHRSAVILRSRHVAHDSHAFSTSRFNRAAHLGSRIIIRSPVNGNVTSLSGKVNGNGSADAFRTASDQRAFIDKFHRAHT